MPYSSYSRRIAATEPMTSLGSDTARGDEAVREQLERLLRGLLAHPDHRLLDAEAIHLLQQQRDRVVGGQALGHVLEHVLDRELEVLLGLAVLGLLADEVVLRESLVRESDHRVDHRETHRSGHDILRSQTTETPFYHTRITAAPPPAVILQSHGVIGKIAGTVAEVGSRGGVTVNTPAPDSRAVRTATEVVALRDMTSAQLARRAKIIEEVIDLIAEVGADAVQMRDVAQRSGVAMATMYRYFSSKENLLAAALEDWQKRLTRRVLGSGGRPDGDALPAVLDYLRRAQRAFYRNPEMTALMLQMMASTDPEVKDIIDQMDRNNVEMFDRLLDGVAPEVISNVSFGLNTALSGALVGLLASRLTLEESLDHVEWVARVLLGAAT